MAQRSGIERPPAARWLVNKRHRDRVFTLLGAVCLLSLLAIGLRAGYISRMNARLLRSWTDDIPRSAGLLRFAVGRAQPIYRMHCAGCHGTDLAGNRQIGAPSLRGHYWLYGNGTIGDIEQTLLYGIRSGHHKAHSLADMPAFATARPYARYALSSLTPGEVDDVIQFLRLAEQRPADADAARRGYAVYNGKAQCYDCHTSDLRGDNYIGAPNLRDDKWLYGDGSDESLRASIEYGRAGSCPAWGSILSRAAVRALAVYIYSSSR
jgi:cytochrome c oxidase cbb3-type subunit 3